MLEPNNIEYDRFLDCVHCGLCTSTCPTYLETGDENDNPRGRIYLMRAVTDQRLEYDEDLQRHLDLCLDCRACETACPSGVQYGRILEPFRVRAHNSSDADSKKIRGALFKRWLSDRRRLRLALGPVKLVQRLGLDRTFRSLTRSRLFPTPLRRMVEQLPTLEPGSPSLVGIHPAQGEQRACVALFLGCVADAMFRSMHAATVRVLQANGVEVVVPASQSCCGALSYHQGDIDPALNFMERNANAFDSLTLDAVVVNVAGCGSMWKDSPEILQEERPQHPVRERMQALAGKVQDISEFLHALPLRPPENPLPVSAVYADACHLLHAQGIGHEPRELLRNIPQLRLTNIEETEICCGAAGSYSLTQEAMSKRLAARKVDHILAANPQVIVSANIGCRLQIQAELRRRQLHLPVYHPTELLDLSYRGLSI